MPSIRQLKTMRICRWDSPSPGTAVAAAPAGAAATAVLGEGLSHRQILIVFSGLMLGMFLAALDQTIVGTALPTIVNSLHGLNHISWVVTAYLLTSTISTPLYGKLSDQLGRKGIFQFAIVIFLIGSVLSGFSQNMGELIAFPGSWSSPRWCWSPPSSCGRGRPPSRSCLPACFGSASSGCRPA